MKKMKSKHPCCIPVALFLFQLLLALVIFRLPTSVYCQVMGHFKDPKTIIQKDRMNDDRSNNASSFVDQQYYADDSTFTNSKEETGTSPDQQKQQEQEQKNMNDEVVVQQQQQQQKSWSYPLDETIKKKQPRPVNILSLGGSGAWGATLDDRYDAYPYLVGSSLSGGSSDSLDPIDNFATPDMGSYYSASCLQSLVPPDKNYDVILLEFVSSNVEEERFVWLLQRLRERYPDAILIYIHIWPLRALLQNKFGQQPDTTVNLADPNNFNWMWYRGDNKVHHNLDPAMDRGTRPAVAEYGGYFTHIPLPQDPKDAVPWFSQKDWWHLNAMGHALIANEILQLLSTMQNDVFKPKRLNTFGFGDQCYNWIYNGKATLNFSDAFMTKVSSDSRPTEQQDASSVDTWFLQTDHSDKPAEIQFESKLSTTASIIFAYISNRELESLYSSLEVTANGQHPVTINPNIFYTPKLSPKVKYATVGTAIPGKNIVQLKTVTLQQPLHEVYYLPFRLVGVFLNEDISNSTRLPVLTPKQSMGHHIIYCFMQPDPRKSSFHINYDVVESVISTTAKRLSPMWDVHVITEGDEAIKRFSAHSTFKVIDYRDAFFSHILKRFKSAYVSQSPNDIEYEKFCMYRWIIIYEYVAYLQMHGVFIKHILTLDSDLVVLTNPFNVDHAVYWNNIESYKIIDGGAIMWSLPGLGNYVDFLMDIYSSRDSAIQWVTKYGTKSHCREDTSLLIPCFFQGQEKFMWHVSDMYWYSAWSELKPASRYNVNQFHKFDCAVIGMYTGEDFHFTRRGADIIYKKEALCVVHFNSKSKAVAIPFTSFVTGEEPELVINGSSIVY